MAPRFAFFVLALLSLGSAAGAQQYDVDMRQTDPLTGGSGSSSITIQRPQSSLGAGPQLDLSGGLADTLTSGGSSGGTSNNLCSQISCGYGVQSNSSGGGSTSGTLDKMQSSDSLR
jgi:hypothetical protein